GCSLVCVAPVYGGLLLSNSVLGMTASDTVAAASLSGVRQKLSCMCREWALTLKNGMPRKLFEATLVISSELHFRPPCLARICLTALRSAPDCSWPKT